MELYQLNYILHEPLEDQGEQDKAALHGGDTGTARVPGMGGDPH